MKRFRFPRLAVLALSLLAVTNCKKEEASNPLLACRQPSGGIGVQNGRTILFWIDHDFGCGPLYLTSIRNTETNSGGYQGSANPSITKFFATQPACGTTGAITIEVERGYEYEYTISCTGKQWKAKVTTDCSSTACIPIQLK